MSRGCYIKKDDDAEELYDVICLNCGHRVWYATGSSLEAAKKKAEQVMKIAKISVCENCGSSLESGEDDV